MVFFNDTATTEIYTLSLHDALPISDPLGLGRSESGSEVLTDALVVRARDDQSRVGHVGRDAPEGVHEQDRKSTRLNSSHANISYAVFCLKKNNTQIGRAHRLTTIPP